MAKIKKQLTTAQQKNKARRIQYALFASEFIAIPTPYIIMGAINFNDWFIYNPEGWKIGLGGTLAIAIMSLATLLVSKQKENKNLTNGFITLIIGWYAFAFVFLMLAKVLNEIYIIMAYGGLGMISAFGLDIKSKQFKKKADNLKEAINKANNELATEKAKEEIVRVKIKK